MKWFAIIAVLAALVASTGAQAQNWPELPDLRGCRMLNAAVNPPHDDGSMATPRACLELHNKLILKSNHDQEKAVMLCAVTHVTLWKAARNTTPLPPLPADIGKKIMVGCWMVVAVINESLATRAAETTIQSLRP
jgi:hypothetical protein